ncbi:nicotinate-nucleotide--dimethylbenzimidazole phosphoribosyltransferase [Pseudofulvibacter geojedonensis]|uniref:Nicotinate-nucleotide--dimethylbenzimidazole phosphoribosyltransferase n=1 Tax=Pseudofulvibacter geojedonensis TaxID=1123758 RepID=A0ABW3I070_9FLAO
MISFNIDNISNDLKQVLTDKINNKTKPLGALGMLETIALQVGLIQNSIQPQIKKPSIVVFAGDHGIAKKGEVNPFPQEVTAQMVLNFVNNGAAINVLCNSNNLELHIVDAGVNFEFSNNLIIDSKIALGTQNYEDQPAMTLAQCEEAIQKGAEIVRKIHTDGCNTIGFGEMGIGNTSSASLIMSSILNIPIEDCVGAGTGLSKPEISKKATILKSVIKKHNVTDPLDILHTYGGFEIAMICGAFLAAAELKMTILVDGFIVTAALLVAQKINSAVLDYCVFGHTSGEQGHQKMLSHLNATPILNIGLRLGEGTGAALAMPVIKASVNFLNEMASFSDANVSNN